MVVTFYSFKGGVGRSMCVANVADILARQGLRVLMIDFDLEAPGLEQYFQITHRAVLRQPGLLDLLLAYKRSMSVASGPSSAEPEFKQLDRYIGTVYPSLGGTGCLHLLGAGQRETREQLDRYASNLRTFDWQDFYFNWEGELFFEWLRSALVPVRPDASGKPSGYDLVIVDSRTGVTEMGGICTYQLADVIVMLSAANHQNRQGTVNVGADFLSPPVQVARRDRPLEILAVPARVEQTDPQLLEQFIRTFEEQFATFLPERLRAAGVGFRDLLIPYEPAYAFEERVISDPSRASTRGKIAGAFERIAHAVSLVALPEHAAALANAAEANADNGAPSTLQYDATRRFAGYDAFVTFAADDERTARVLVDELRGLGAEVFVDMRALVTGQDWRARAEQVIFHSRVCFVCYGSASPDVEVLAAIASVTAARDVRTVPVLLAGSTPEAIASGPFRSLMPLDLRDGISDDERDMLRLAVPRERPDTPEGRPRPSTAIRAVPTPPSPTAPAAESQVEMAHAPSASPSVVDFGAPYPGLRAFSEADAGFLFGREECVDVVCNALDARRLVVVAGPSACGKTSLVEAGVVPALHRRDPTVRWAYHRVVAERDALAALDRAWQQLDAMACERKLLFVDQLERLLRDVGSGEQAAFLAKLGELAAAQDDARRIVIGVRDVRLADLAAIGPKGLLDADRVIAIPALAGVSLRAAIERPAERAGLAFEPGLVDRLVTDWGQDQRFLPFLQAVLHDLWVRRREGFLTNRAYDEIPDPVDALGEQVYADTPNLHTLMARVVPRLIALCHDLVVTGASCLIDEVTPSDASPVDVRRVLWHLVDAHLVVAWAGVDGHGRVAPTFARQQWRRAEEWYEADGAFLDWLTALHAQRLDWERRQRDTGALLGGGVLAEARGKLATRRADLTALEIDFIERSQLLDVQAAQRTRRSRYVLVGLALVAAAVLGVQTYMKRVEVKQAEQAAQAQQQAAAVLVDAGDRAVVSGDNDGALRSYDAALREHPDDLPALMRRGTLRDQLGDFAKAIEDFTRVITLTSALDSTASRKLHGDALQARALANLHGGLLTAALADADAAVVQATSDAAVHATRAAVLERMGRDALDGSPDQRARFTQALQAYDASIAIRPDPDVTFARGVLRERLGQNDLARADFTTVAGAKDASPQAQQAARARLEPAQGTAQDVDIDAMRRRAHVTLLIGDSADLEVVARLDMALAARGYTNRARRLLTSPTSAAEVRYFFNQDQRVASDVQAVTGSAVAEAGYNVDVGARLMTATDGHDAGAVEIWLPSLSRALSIKRSYRATAYE